MSGHSLGNPDGDRFPGGTAGIVQVADMVWNHAGRPDGLVDGLVGYKEVAGEAVADGFFGLDGSFR